MDNLQGLSGRGDASLRSVDGALNRRLTNDIESVLGIQKTDSDFETVLNRVVAPELDSAEDVDFHHIRELNDRINDSLEKLMKEREMHANDPKFRGPEAAHRRLLLGS